MRILDGRRPLHTGFSLGSGALLLVVAAIALPRLSAREEAANSAPVPASRETSKPIVANAGTKNSDVQEKRDGEPAAARLISGIVRDGNRNPVADVMITGTEQNREIRFTNGELDDFVRHDWLMPRPVQTGVIGSRALR